MDMNSDDFCLYHIQYRDVTMLSVSHFCRCGISFDVV